MNSDIEETNMPDKRVDEEIARANQTIRLEKKFEAALVNVSNAISMEAGFSEKPSEEIEKAFRDKIANLRLKLLQEVPLTLTEGNELLMERLDKDTDATLQTLLEKQSKLLRNDAQSVIAALTDREIQAVIENPDYLIEAAFLLNDELAAFSHVASGEYIQTVLEQSISRMITAAVQSLVQSQRYREALTLVTTVVHDKDLGFNFQADTYLTKQEIHDLRGYIQTEFELHIHNSLKQAEFAEEQQEKHLRATQTLAVNRAIEMISDEGNLSAANESPESFQHTLDQAVLSGAMSEDQAEKLKSIHSLAFIVDDDTATIVDIELGLAFEDIYPDDILDIAANGHISQPTLKALRQRVGTVSYALRRKWTLKILEAIGGVKGRLSVVPREKCDLVAEALGQFRTALEAGTEVSEAGEKVLKQFLSIHIPANP